MTLRQMGWFGKLMGGGLGFLVGGPLGAALGAALGHQVDQNGDDLSFYQSRVSPEEAERFRRVFCFVLFKVMGHLAKSDGRISEDEIACARGVMARLELAESSRMMAVRAFSEGKQTPFCLRSTLQLLLAESTMDPRLIRFFVALQLEAALSDGDMHPAKERILLEACEVLHFSHYEYFGMRTRLETERRWSGGARRPNFGWQARRDERWQDARHESIGLKREGFIKLQEAYQRLDLPPNASPLEVKRAYRRAISRHHPDKLTAQGASPDHVLRATQETQRIQKAYELICRTHSSGLGS